MAQKHLDLFEAIADGAASEYFADNTETFKCVGNYAAGAMNLHLTDRELKYVHSKLLELEFYRKNSPGCSNNYYHTFTKPLEDF